MQREPVDCSNEPATATNHSDQFESKTHVNHQTFDDCVKRESTPSPPPVQIVRPEPPIGKTGTKTTRPPPPKNKTKQNKKPKKHTKQTNPNKQTNKQTNNNNNIGRGYFMYLKKHNWKNKSTDKIHQYL